MTKTLPASSPSREAAKLRRARRLQWTKSTREDAEAWLRECETDSHFTRPDRQGPMLAEEYDHE